MRVLLLALAAVLALPAAAQASLRITWPQQRTYAPGETLTVKVVSSKPVRAALVRESASGKVMRTVARRTLRRGMFSAAVPAAGRYSLRIAKRARTVTVAAPAPPDPPPADPLPAPPSPTSCYAPSGDRAELHLSATTVQPGATLPFELVNTSAACLLTGVGYAFERRLEDGTWEPVPTDQDFILLGVLVPAGTSYARTARIPADFAPGIYRLLDSASGNGENIPVAAEFEVVPY